MNRREENAATTAPKNPVSIDSAWKYPFITKMLTALGSIRYNILCDTYVMQALPTISSEYAQQWIAGDEKHLHVSLCTRFAHYLYLLIFLCTK